MKSTAVRTTIEINAALLHEARTLTAITKKRALVERGLEALIRQEKLRRLTGMFGKTSLAVTPGILRRMRGDA